MRRIVLMLVLVSCAGAQVRGPLRGAPRDNPAADGPTAESLLRIVHDDAQQLSPADRAAVLSRAIQSAQRVEPGMVLSWTEELFNLASQIPEERRASVEVSPVIVVAGRDIEAGMRLLERMDAPSKSMLDAGNDPRIGAAGGVFIQYWGGSGRARFRGAETDDEDEADQPADKKSEQTKKLDRMRSIAARLGSTGVYPYAAFAAPLESLKRDEPAVQEALYAELLGAFRASPGRYADVTEFVRMLMNTRGIAPPALYREALTMAVAAIDRIPADSLPTMTFSIRGQSTSGQLNNAASMQLMRLVPLIRDVDPAWAKQVLEQHQDVAQFEQSRSVRGAVVSAAVTTGDSMPPGRTPQRQLAPVRAMATNSTDQAKMFANQISDPAARAAANAEIAAGLASQNPQEAGAYLNQASEGLANIDDPASRLMVMTSLARAAFETGDRASAAAYSERGFRLGEDVVRADYDANPDKPMMSLKGVSDLNSLVNTSMRIDPAGTVTRIQAIRYPLLRANLMLTAVDAAGVRPNIRGGTVRMVGGIDSVQPIDSAPPATIETRRVLTPTRVPASKPPQ